MGPDGVKSKIENATAKVAESAETVPSQEVTEEEFEAARAATLKVITKECLDDYLRRYPVGEKLKERRESLKVALVEIIKNIAREVKQENFKMDDGERISQEVKAALQSKRFGRLVEIVDGKEKGLFDNVDLKIPGVDDATAEKGTAAKRDGVEQKPLKNESAEKLMTMQEFIQEFGSVGTSYQNDKGERVLISNIVKVDPEDATKGLCVQAESLNSLTRPRKIHKLSAVELRQLLKDFPQKNKEITREGNTEKQKVQREKFLEELGGKGTECRSRDGEVHTIRKVYFNQKRGQNVIQLKREGYTGFTSVPITEFEKELESGAFQMAEDFEKGPVINPEESSLDKILEEFGPVDTVYENKEGDRLKFNFIGRQRRDGKPEDESWVVKVEYLNRPKGSTVRYLPPENLREVLKDFDKKTLDPEPEEKMKGDKEVLTEQLGGKGAKYLNEDGKEVVISSVGYSDTRRRYEVYLSEGGKMAVVDFRRDVAEKRFKKVGKKMETEKATDSEKKENVATSFEYAEAKSPASGAAAENSAEGSGEAEVKRPEEKRQEAKKTEALADKDKLEKKLGVTFGREYINEKKGQRMKVQGIENGMVSVEMLPFGTTVDKDGVNEIPLNSNWDQLGAQEISLADFEGMFQGYQEEQTQQVPGKKERVKETRKESLGLEGKLEKGESVALVDLKKEFGPVGTFYEKGGSDGQGIEVLAYQHHKEKLGDGSHWKVKLGGVGTNRTKLVTLAEMLKVREAYPERKESPEGFDEEITSKQFIERFGKRKKVIFKSKQEGFPAFVIRKNKFKKSSQKFAITLESLGGSETDTLSLSELEALLEKGGYEKESRIDEKKLKGMYASVAESYLKEVREKDWEAEGYSAGAAQEIIINMSNGEIWKELKHAMEEDGEVLPEKIDAMLSEIKKESLGE